MLYYKSEWYACCSLRLNILYKERLVLHFEEVKRIFEVLQVICLLTFCTTSILVYKQMNIPILQKNTSNV